MQCIHAHIVQLCPLASQITNDIFSTIAASASHQKSLHKPWVACFAFCLFLVICRVLCSYVSADPRCRLDHLADSVPASAEAHLSSKGRATEVLQSSQPQADVPQTAVLSLPDSITDGTVSDAAGPVGSASQAVGPPAISHASGCDHAPLHKCVLTPSDPPPAGQKGPPGSAAPLSDTSWSHEGVPNSAANPGQALACQSDRQDGASAQDITVTPPVVTPPRPIVPSPHAGPPSLPPGDLPPAVNAQPPPTPASAGPVVHSPAFGPPGLPTPPPGFNTLPSSSALSPAGLAAPSSSAGAQQQGCPSGTRWGPACGDQRAAAQRHNTLQVCLAQDMHSVTRACTQQYMC